MKKISVSLLIIIVLLGCYDNRKIPEGYFALFGHPESRMLQEARMGLMELRNFRYSDISVHTKLKKGTDNIIDILEVENQIQQGKTLIWLFRSMLEENALRFLINQYPHQRFALICEGPVQEPESDQIVNVFYAVNEASYLAGYMAAKMSRRQYLGVVTGDSTKDSPIYAAGFFAGALAASPEVKISTVHLTDSFSSEKIKKAALELHGSGADIIFLALEENLEETLLAAQEKNFMVVGCELQYNTLYKKNLLTTVLKKIDKTVFFISADVLDNVYPGGTVIRYGLAEGLVGLSKEPHLHVPPPLRREIEQLVLSIITGEIKVPKNQSELEQLGFKLKFRPVKKYI